MLRTTTQWIGIPLFAFALITIADTRSAEAWEGYRRGYSVYSSPGYHGYSAYHLPTYGYRSHSYGYGYGTSNRHPARPHLDYHPPRLVPHHGHLDYIPGHFHLHHRNHYHW